MYVSVNNAQPSLINNEKCYELPDWRNYISNLGKTCIPNQLHYEAMKMHFLSVVANAIPDSRIGGFQTSSDTVTGVDLCSNIKPI